MPFSLCTNPNSLPQNITSLLSLGLRIDTLWVIKIPCELRGQKNIVVKQRIWTFSTTILMLLEINEVFEDLIQKCY